MKTKFRAWDKYLKKMFHNVNPIFDDDGNLDFIIYEYGNTGHDMIEIDLKKWDSAMLYHYDEGIPVELMQYTGLKGYMGDKYDDHQEKSVYKGDIIDIFWEDFPAGHYRENHLVGVVDIDNTGTSWVLKNAKYESDVPKQIPSEIHGWSISLEDFEEDELEEVFLHNFNLTSDDITILGNIYQNKELLEGE